MKYIMFFLVGLEINASTLYWKALIACALLEATQILYHLCKTNNRKDVR